MMNSLRDSCPVEIFTISNWRDNLAIKLKSRKMLWGRAANRCAFESCRRELVIDATETDDESLVGEECHIVGQSQDGPRGDSSLTQEQRDKYSNLILLCAVHHKVVDDQPGLYSVQQLHAIKNDHERWVRESLQEFDPARQRDDEQYAQLIEELCVRIAIDEWQNWSSWVLGGGGYPRIEKDVHANLEAAREWILSRIWPQRYPEIESSFQNLRLVLQDFLNLFSEHCEPFGDDMLATRKFYRIDEWNPKRYDRLLKEYEFHVELVEDLMLELTRAANFVCDRIRENYFPSFRLTQGVLLVSHGPYSNMSYRTIRTEYRANERTEIPYPGLAEFKKMRMKRDFCIGKGERA